MRSRHHSGTGLLRVLDHGQMSHLVVIAPVTVLSCTCSPPQRTCARCRPVWPMHSTCKRWTYIWASLTSTSSSPFYHVLPVASLCRNWMCRVVHQVCSQGVKHTCILYVHSCTHTNTEHTTPTYAYKVSVCMQI